MIGRLGSRAVFIDLLNTRPLRRNITVKIEYAGETTAAELGVGAGGLPDRRVIARCPVLRQGSGLDDRDVSRD
jgi:hypothetical protein